MRTLHRLAMLIALAMTSTFGSAAIYTFETDLSGADETPPNASPATGFATIVINDDLDTLWVDVSWAGLIGGNPAAAHIHCCTPPGTNVGVAVGFPAFPTTLSGSYSHLFDLLDPTIYTTGFRNTFGGGTAAGAEAALITGLIDGQAYVNIHNTSFPGGEVRGFPAQVPEPATLALLGIAAAGMAWRRRAT